jgi:type IV secretion system protein VirB9
MKKIKILILCFLLPSCTTIDVDRRVRDSGAGSQEDVVAATVVVPEPEIIILERPVFIPEGDPPPAPGQPRSVADSINSGIVKPEDYSHAAVVYDYNPDWVYEVYAQPLRVTDICLEPGERAVEPPFVSDSERWVLGGGVSYENGAQAQHIYVKPVSSGLSASLIINTDRRVYRVILRSYSSTHMPLVRWRYPSEGLPNSLYRPQAAGNADLENFSIDPRFLSFNYRMTYTWGRKPSWLPELVFDDGAKTYVSFPPGVLQRELPAIFENRRDLVNYRVLGNLVVIDKLVEKITIRINRVEVTVEKKRG